MLLNAAKIAGHDKAVSLLEALIAKLNQEAGKEATVEEAYANMDSGEIYDRMIDEVTRHLDLYVERKTGKVVHYNEEKRTRQHRCWRSAFHFLQTSRFHL